MLHRCHRKQDPLDRAEPRHADKRNTGRAEAKIWSGLVGSYPPMWQGLSVAAGLMVPKKFVFFENIPSRPSSTGVMDGALKRHWLMAEEDPGSYPATFSPDRTEDPRLSEALHRNYAGLRKFIRHRVADRSEAEDILQDVFYELVEAYRMMSPIEQVTAWLFRVARNRITDLFRRKQREEQRNAAAPITEDGVAVGLEELLPSPDAGPEAAYIQGVLLDEIETALDDLPEEQREVFVAHELLGHSFQDISAQTGVSVNTLLSRKHYAVRRLRKRLRTIYDEFLKG